MSLVGSVLGDMADGLSLPITRKGLFFKDDFFSGYQKDYSNAVEDVLSRWGNKASKADRFASYRRLRERDASEDSLAATISDTDENYMIVVDMSEYASGQITVQTVQLSAVVEGQCGAKCYKRSFPLPSNTIIDRVLADLSDENILTVTAPKKGRVVAISTDGSQSSQAAQPSVGSSIADQIIPSEGATTQVASSSSAVTTKERTIPLNVEGEISVTSAPTAVQAVKNEAATSSERRSSQTRIIPLNVEGETTSSSAITSEVSERIIPMKVQDQQAYRTVTSSYNNRVLPINKRGRFFQDPAFENVWKDFEGAIDDLVARRGSRAGMEQNDDRFQSYRNLRDVVKQDDNQASTVTKESNECKIVVDVKDFVDGHLDVKALKGVIIVTGKKGHCSFERQFTVAGLTQPDKVAAAISADGVLTITAPL